MNKEIMKRNSPPPVMFNPQAFVDAMKTPPPQLPYDAGIFSGLMDGFRRRRLERNAELDARIAEHQAKAFGHAIESAKAMATFQDDIYTHLKRNEHERTMMGLEQEDKKMIIQTRYYEMKNEEMEFLKRQKEFDREYGSE